MDETLLIFCSFCGEALDFRTDIVDGGFVNAFVMPCPNCTAMDDEDWDSFGLDHFREGW